VLLFKFVGKSSCCIYLVLFSFVNFKTLSMVQLTSHIARAFKTRGCLVEEIFQKTTCLLIACFYYQINSVRHVSLSQLCLEFTFSPSRREREREREGQRERGSGCIYHDFLNILSRGKLQIYEVQVRCPSLYSCIKGQLPVAVNFYILLMIKL